MSIRTKDNKNYDLIAVTNVWRDIWSVARDAVTCQVPPLAPAAAFVREMRQRIATAVVPDWMEFVLQKKINDLHDKVNKDVETRLKTIETDKTETINGIYLRWGVALILVLIGLMSWHILGYKI